MLLALRDNLEISQRKNKHNEIIDNEPDLIHCGVSLRRMPCNMLWLVYPFQVRIS